MIRYFYAFIMLSVQLLNAQVSLSDINNLTNKQLDVLREELQENVQKPIVKDIVEAPPAAVSIKAQNQIEKKNLDYFGYEYFQKDISFFDNIPTPPDYKLGPGDEIIISMWGETNYRNNITINKDGMIYFENIGFINLSNLTIDSAEKLLKQSLSKIYATLTSDDNKTYLSLSLGKLKSLNVYFSGQVENPGVNLVHPFSDIFSALIQSGGISRTGTMRDVQLIRNNTIIATVDFYSFFMDGKNNFSNIKLVDGDVIHIPSAKKRVSISGDINRSSTYELLSNESIEDLINYGLGLKSTASSNLVLNRILSIEKRSTDDYARTKQIINIKDLEGIDLNDGDSISVPSISTVISSVVVNGRVKSPGSYPANDAYLMDILNLAGGFNDPFFRESIDDKKIIVLRRDSNQLYNLEFNVSYDKSDNFKLIAGDQIFVYENTNYLNDYTFTINGEVKRPGSYSFKGKITIREAIDIAGGLSENAFVEAIALSGTFISSDTYVTGKLSNITLDTEINFGSVISVPSKNNVFRVTGNVYNPGLIVYNKSINLTSAIELAGGLKPDTLKKGIYLVRANGKIDRVRALERRTKKIFPGDSLVIPQDPNREKFDLSSFVAQLSSTLANIAAIIILVDSVNND